MPLTMKDIARELGVSVVTVSKVLRNHEDISDATRKRVLDKVKELNYRPNLAARGLVTGRSYLVGLIVPDLVHPFFAEVAKQIAKALVKKGYYLIISSSEEDARLEQRELDQMLGRGLDAIIIASCDEEANFITRARDQSGPPFVLIDRNLPEVAVSFIGVDDVLVGRMATEHLIAVGCEAIAHIRGPESSPGTGRLKGYRMALAKHGVQIPDGYVSGILSVDESSRQSGAVAMRELLGSKKRPDGIFCYNDPIAIGAISTVLEAGLRVPEDVAVIGCGNLHYDDVLQVPLSSIDQNTAEIGALAARTTIAVIESKQARKPKTHLVEPRLIARASTQRR
jgi:LacI family transcriptional regulator